MPFKVGEPVPWFKAPTVSEPDFAFEGAAGRYVLLAFLPLDDAGRLAALRALAAHQTQFDLGRLVAFVVVRDPEAVANLRDLRALRWMPDPDLRISRLFDPGGDGSDAPTWLLLDPSLRIMAIESQEGTGDFFRRLGDLPAPSDHAGVPLHAPVLTIPRVFEPELCQRLIALHEADGGRFTGVMRDQGERTVAVMDELKKRRDIRLGDPELVKLIRNRLDRRLLPMIERCLGFTVTHIERYLVSCYDADDGGVFHAHRDSTTYGTAHRKFACSINLNDDFEGGDLRFAEFGAATYRPPLGGAVVFSCDLMHEARPVKRGRRYAFLPFLYDEAGAAVLAAYEARIRQATEAAT
jgi:predicted 2-oxoglutarate/Fe(II)-dependent dioxygenase YbiX